MAAITLTSSKIDWSDLAGEAARLVAEHDELPMSGAAKRKRVIAKLAKVADDAIEFGDGPIGRLFEMLDGPAIRLVLTGMVEGAVAARKAFRS